MSYRWPAIANKPPLHRRTDSTRLDATHLRSDRLEAGTTVAVPDHERDRREDELEVEVRFTRRSHEKFGDRGCALVVALYSQDRPQQDSDLRVTPERRYHVDERVRDRADRERDADVGPAISPREQEDCDHK